MRVSRRPQINFQVDPALKLLYDEAHEQGHWVTRFCAAGLLMLVEDPRLRAKAIRRLRDWEEEYADASAAQIRAFVEGAEGALQRGAQEDLQEPPARRRKKGAKGG